MKIGIHALLTKDTVGPAELARAAEERGFDALSFPEHTHIPVNGKSEYPMGGPIPPDYRGFLDPLVALGAAAAVTERLVLGTAILLINQHDPFTVAKAIATLDQLTGGNRLFIGVGAGWHREEMVNHGVDPKTRGAVLVEKVNAVRRLLTDEAPEFHGKYVDFDPVYLDPKREGVPFYIGGDSDAALRRIAEHGDGYLPAGLPADHIATRLARLRELTDRTFSVTLASPLDDLENMRKYAELGIERVNLFLTPMQRDHTREPLSLDETFRRLDSYMPYIEEFKN